MTIDMMPIRIAVTGITGRMGKEVIQCIMKHQKQGLAAKIVLGAAIVRLKSAMCGIDIREFIKSDIDKKIIITDDIESVKENFDILIDFTNPTITIEYLKFCMKHGKNMVIGTTGFNRDGQDLIKFISKKIGIVYSSNFSIGITVMLQLLKEVAKTIGNIVDIDIIESHHNKKIDVPSGTALMIRNIISSNIEKNNIFHESIYNNIHCNDRFQKLSALDHIKIHSIRSGDIIGEHVVSFSGLGERLEVIHKASSRKIFANGAVYAASWLGKTKTGLFDLNDVLVFKKI